MKNPKKKSAYLILLLTIGLVLGGCDLANTPLEPLPPTPTPTLPALARSVDIDEQAIVIPIPIDPPSFNAYLNNTGYEVLIGELVYGALAEIGPDGNYYPELAETLPTLSNGDLSEDGRTVTWRLRSGLRWSDGEPFTSADVLYTWEALRDSGIWTPGLELIETVETPDPLTVVIQYREFYPNYLLQFGGRGIGIFPAHHCGPTNAMLFWDCNFEPVSLGPFRLGQWLEGERLVFLPNPNYYIPDRPFASQLIFEIEPDPDFRQRSLGRGTAHLDIWPDGEALFRLDGSGTATVFRTNPPRFVLKLVANLSDQAPDGSEIPHPSLSNPQIRRALRHAIDVGRLNDEAFGNQAIPVDTELFELDCDIPLYEYNPGLAAALLDDAGWVLTEGQSVRTCQNCGTAEEGTPLSLTSYTYIEFGSELNLAHRLIRGMFAEVGVDLQLEVAEGSELWNTWAEEGIELRGNFDLNLWDDGYFGVDPTIYLTNYFDPRSIPSRDNPLAGLNVSRYRNPELLEIFDALHTPLPENRRRVLLCEVATTLYEDLPHIPLLAFPDLYAISIDVQGITPHIYDTVTWNAGEWQLVGP